MKYFLAKNGLEYPDIRDAEILGGGVVGYREPKEVNVKITYEEYTGEKAPQSPVDHVITPAVPPAMPVAEKPIAKLFNQNPVQSPVQTPVQTQETKVQTESPLVAEIVKTELEIVVQTPIEYEYASTWLTQLTDEQLKELSKQNRIVGLHLMKRDTMIKKLGAIPKKVA